MRRPSPGRAKVVLFLPTLGGGGAERAMLNLSKILSKQYRVSLVLSKAEGAYLPEAKALGVELVDLKCHRPRWALVPFFHYVKTVRPEVVISALETSNIFGAMARLVGRYRLVLTEHNTPSLHYRRQKDPLLRSYTYWASPFYRLADRVVAVSKGVAEDAIRAYRLPPERVTVIYNLVVTPSFFERMRTPVPPPVFYGRAKGPLIVAAGRLSSQKGFDLLLRALRLVLEETSVRLLLLGEGPERASLERLAQDLGVAPYVSMPGFTPHLPAYLANADLFVLSSRWEGLPTVLIEALAAGVPVVATDCPSGPREILEGGRWGRLVPVEDIQALAQAMLAQLRNPLPPPPESWARFTEEVVSQQWRSLMDEILA